MLIEPLVRFPNKEINGWGVEFSDWNGFFSSDKSGGKDVHWFLIDQTVRNSSQNITLNVTLPLLKSVINYSESIDGNRIARKVVLTVQEDGILGDLVLRCRIGNVSNAEVIHNCQNHTSKIEYDRNYFLTTESSTQVNVSSKLQFSINDSCLGLTNFGRYRYVRFEPNGFRFHSRLIGNEFYQNSFSPYFLLPFRTKIKQKNILDDKYILIRERRRTNMIHRYWQRVPASYVKKGDVIQLKQVIMVSNV